jgi:hypothetical protein
MASVTRGARQVKVQKVAPFTRPPSSTSAAVPAGTERATATSAGTDTAATAQRHGPRPPLGVRRDHGPGGRQRDGEETGVGERSHHPDGRQRPEAVGQRTGGMSADEDDTV